MKKLLLSLVALGAIITLAACSQQSQSAQGKTTNQTFSQLAYDGQTRYWYITEYDSDDGITKDTYVYQISRIKDGKLETYDLVDPENKTGTLQVKDLRKKSDESIFKSAKKNAKANFKNARTSAIKTYEKYQQDSTLTSDEKGYVEKALASLKELNYNTFNKKAVHHKVTISIKTDSSGNGTESENLGAFPSLDVSAGELTLTKDIENIEASVSGTIYDDTWKGLRTDGSYAFITRGLDKQAVLSLDSPDDKHAKVDEED